MVVKWKKKKIEITVSFRKVGTSFQLTGQRYVSDHHMLLPGRLQHAHASHIALRKYHIGKDGQSNFDISGWPSAGTSLQEAR